jgi:MYXO-CTERM domain-containing protein
MYMLLALPSVEAANVLTAQDTSAAAGDTDVTVSIVLSNDETMRGYQFELAYDEAAFEVTAISRGSYGADMSLFAYSGKGSGSLMVLSSALSETEDLTAGSGTLVDITFDVDSSAGAGDYVLDLFGVVLADPDGLALASEEVDGTFTVTVAEPVDEDGDGYTSKEDCDDTDADVYPGAPEIPDDGIDQDCDGVDETTEDTGDPGDTGTPVDTGTADTGPVADTADTSTGDTGSEDTASGDTGPSGGEDTGSVEKDESGGCGCSAAPAGSGWLASALLFGLIGRRRRRV